MNAPPYYSIVLVETLASQHWWYCGRFPRVRQSNIEFVNFTPWHEYVEFVSCCRCL